MRRINTNEEKYTTISSKAFSKYLREVYHYKPLSVDEEVALCNRIDQGDERARETLIKHNLRFVISVAKQYYTSSTSTLQDLVNEGNYGLIIATQNYDSTKGFKFITYAVYWIRNTILKYINNIDNIVRLPNHKLYSINKIKDEFIKLEQKLQKVPSVTELKGFVGPKFTSEEINDFFNHYFQSDKLLDDSMSDEADGKTYIDMLENNVFPHTDVLTNTNDSNYLIEKILNILKNDNQVYVITKTFGLDGEEPQPIEIISRELNLSKERVRQIKERSLILLRNKLKLDYIYN